VNDTDGGLFRIIVNENNPNYSIADSSSFDKPFSVADLSVASTAYLATDDHFDLGDRATMFGGVLDVGLVPPKPFAHAMVFITQKSAKRQD